MTLDALQTEIHKSLRMTAKRMTYVPSRFFKPVFDQLLCIVEDCLRKISIQPWRKSFSNIFHTKALKISLVQNR